MDWPDEIGVMVLPRVILFPQAYLPLYIFEPRYRRMLADALDSHRLFCVALQQPDRRRITPVAVAGVGIIRAARTHPDGSSHMVLQGLARVQLTEATRYRPYRTHRFRVLSSRGSDSVAIDALTARLLELVAERIQKQPPTSKGETSPQPPVPFPAQVSPGGMEFLAHVDNPEQIADLVSWALLSNPGHRQLLLETLDVETRLRRLIHFLLAEGRPADPA